MVQRLREAGHQALWAGGCVRDQLLGATPKDYDVATSALPDQVREVFGRKRTLAVGAAFGVITVLGPKRAGQIEVATFRTDAGYSDGRRPDGVRFTDAEHDACRRDFTINGLFYDPVDERVIDYVGGRADLQARLVRAIGDASDRFAEDKLRMLRAVRFAAALDFDLDPATADAIRRHAGEITVVSAERVGMELRRMLLGDGCARAVRVLGLLGLLRRVIPELDGVDPPALDRFERARQRLTAPTLPAVVACLLEPHADGAAAGRRASELKWTKKESERTRWLLDNAESLAGADGRPWSQTQPLLANDGGRELVDVFHALHDDPAAVAFCRQRLAWPRERLDPPPLLTGDVLINNGWRPGPGFAGLLRMARAAQLDGRVRDESEALALVRRSTPPSA